MLASNYPHRGIWELKALEATLQCSVEELRDLCGRSAKLYHSWDEPKANGGVRKISAVREPLKTIQGFIKTHFLRKVKFPNYLQGSIHDPLETRNALANAKMHEGAAFIYTGDLKSFFDNVSATKVRKIWRSFFGFGPDVSEIMVGLTTLNERLPQGAPTSPGLANLVFFEEEPILVEKLQMLGFRYSRYVDDISFSSNERIDESTIGEAVSLVHAMAKSQGLWIARKKQHFSPDRQIGSVRRKGIKITGYHVDQTVSVPREKRRKVELDLHKLVGELNSSEDPGEIERRFRSLSAKVGQIRKLHPGDFKRCKPKLDLVKEWLARNRKFLKA